MPVEAHDRPVVRQHHQHLRGAHTKWPRFTRNGAQVTQNKKEISKHDGPVMREHHQRLHSRKVVRNRQLDI